VAAVLADMIEGIVIVNALRSPQSDRIRGALWAAVADLAITDDTGGTIRAQVA
jgi:hypothetical protein